MIIFRHTLIAKNMQRYYFDFHLYLDVVNISEFKKRYITVTCHINRFRLTLSVLTSANTVIVEIRYVGCHKHCKHELG